MNIIHTTHRPWEHKTIDKFTLAELVHWVNWYTTGRPGPVVFDAETVVHNILLWERTKLKIRADLFAVVMTKVPEGVTPEDYDKEAIRCAIDDLLTKGWDQYEIVRYLSWLEHVNPLVGEEEALANMKIVKDEVEQRLQKM